MVDIQNIIDYYVNLIIIQYNNKPKARGTVDALVSSALAEGVVFDVQDGFNIDTAIGVQLDILGKYIGVDRFYLSRLFFGKFFGFTDASNPDYDPDFVGLDFTDDFLIDESANNFQVIGFDNADSPDKEGVFLNANDVISTEFKLNDDSYRILLKLKIVQNHANHSFNSIASSIFEFFGSSIVVKDNYDMTMTYIIDDDSANIVNAALQKEVFPRPIGVRLQAVRGADFMGFADATQTSVPDYLVGFNDATLGLVKNGVFLNANNDIIQ